jgi:hypothetical protein
MDVDDRADVGPQAQDLAVQVVADARRHGAVQEPRGRDVCDDDVVERHLLKRHLGMLGVGHAVGKVRVRHTDGKIPQRVVDVTARDDELRVAKQQLRDVLVEGYLAHDQ